MITITWPDLPAFYPDTATLIEVLQQESASSPLNGVGQVLTRPGERWGWSLTFPGAKREDRRALEAHLLRLRGRENLVRMWDFFHEAPGGTIPLTGITLSASIAALADQMALAGAPDGATMLAGSWLEIGGQLFRTVTDAVAGPSTMLIQVAHRSRKAISAGAAVTLYRPTALYMRTESRLELPRQPGMADPAFALDFVEYIAP